MSADVKTVMAQLERAATKATRDGMSRYAIPNENALGVTMSHMKAMSKKIGKDHALAEALWKTGVYEARTLAALVDDPAQVTAAQMDRWCRDFDNWAICDTACFALFDRTASRWRKVTQWASKKDEYQRRAAFALLWGLTVHDKDADDAHYLEGLALIEQASTDERHYVKKAVSMALRATGKRNAALRTAAVATAKRLAASDSASATWIGSDALRELSGKTAGTPRTRGK